MNKYNIAVELLQQASKIPRFASIAIAKLGQLSALHPNEDPGPQFQENKLISCLETTQQTQVVTTTTKNNPRIHKTNTRKPFKYKTKSNAQLVEHLATTSTVKTYADFVHNTTMRNAL